MQRLLSALVLASAVACPAVASALSYKAQGEFLYVSGEVFSNDLSKFKKAMADNPGVKTLVLMDIPGSADDETNLKIIALIRQMGLNTYLTKKSHVSSGGTDLFLGGVQRIMERGAKIGVHSWSNGRKDGADFPDESSEHDMFLDLYESIGIPEDFYWFTLDAAPADDMHYMTDAEIAEFGLLTAPIR